MGARSIAILYEDYGNFFFTVSSDMTIGLFNGKDGTPVAECPDPKKVHAGSIFSATWSPDSTKIFTKFFKVLIAPHQHWKRGCLGARH